jgi:hypothetical protein
MSPHASQTFDPSLHEPGSVAAAGGCSFHAGETGPPGGSGECADDAVVSFEDGAGGWRSGCRLALEELVERGEIEPLGQGA